MRALRELERSEWRALGAVRFIDAITRAPVDAPLRVEAPGALIRRNRSGLFVIHRWQALAAHEPAFQAPPTQPAVGSQTLRLVVDDPQGAYLPLAVSLRLPRNPAAGPDALFQPESVPLYPSSAARLGANWATVRATVTETRSGDALGGALVRILARDQVLARGLSDWRGEALVPVAGVPVTTFSEDEEAVVISEIGVTVEAVFDPAAGRRTPIAAVRSGTAPASLPLVDPASVEARLATLPRSRALELRIAARRGEHVALTIRIR